MRCWASQVQPNLRGLSPPPPPGGVDEIWKFHHGTFDAVCGNFAVASGRGSPFHSLGVIKRGRDQMQIAELIARTVGTGEVVTITYNGGSRPGQPRQIVPISLSSEELVGVEPDSHTHYFNFF